MRRYSRHRLLRNPTHQGTVRGILLKLQMPRVVPPARLRMSHRDRVLMMAHATTMTDPTSIIDTLGTTTSTGIGQSSNRADNQLRCAPQGRNKIMQQIPMVAQWQLQ